MRGGLPSTSPSCRPVAEAVIRSVELNSSARRARHFMRPSPQTPDPEANRTIEKLSAVVLATGRRSILGRAGRWPVLRRAGRCAVLWCGRR
jgi:hypothetical protein